MARMSAATSRRGAIASACSGQGGIFRLKHPSERHPDLPRESAFIFWPRFVWDALSQTCRHYCNDRAPHSAQVCHHARCTGSNVQGHGLTPVSDDEETTLDLLTNTTGAHAAVMHFKKTARLTGVARVV
jgi:hypothetical protein